MPEATVPHRARRTVRLVHATTGRVRLRLPCLHDDPELAQAVADTVAALDGVDEVQVRAWTGSILCRYDPDRLDAAAISDAVCATATADTSGGADRADRRRLARIARQGTGVTHAAAALFKGLDADVLQATDGRLDLADAAALGMLAVSVTKVASARTLPLPSWYDLVWYAYTIFTRTERSAIDKIPHPLTAAGRAPPSADDAASDPSARQ